ncbi:MAG TPA: 3'-5' exonuclease [bacterium]|nr:3'-5' exonuclease [bacterium]
MVENNSIIVVDIETTGLYYEEDSIVEIGICELDLDSGECSELFNQLIRERDFSSKYQNAWIFKNSDLIYEDILNAKPLKVYKKELRKIFKDYPATAYKKRFDFDFLTNRGFKIKELPCPMIIATNILKLPPRKGGTVYKYPTVEETWNFYFPDKKYTEKHRAYDDAVHEALIVYEMYRRKEWKPVIEIEI